MEQLYTILLDNGAKYLACADKSMNLKTKDWCVIRKDFYLDYGQLVNERGPAGDNAGEHPKIERKANVRDQSKANENRMRAKSALRVAAQTVEEMRLPMHLLNSHYSFDTKLLTIQFTAESRVDFRELVKKLAQSLGTRIELRQIGVRDEAAIYGGIGVCGRALCCCTFLKEFKSINVRMAKSQDLSLNPVSISGICGRLKCCLKYEHDGYVEMEKKMPRRGELCECPEGAGRVIDRNILTGQVAVSLDGDSRIVRCNRCQLVVQRLIGKESAPQEEIDESELEQVRHLEG